MNTKTVETKAFLHHIVINSHDSEAGRQAIKELANDMGSDCNTPQYGSPNKEAILVELGNIHVEDATLPDLVDAARNTENYIWILLAENPSTIRVLAGLIGGNPPNLSVCIAVKLAADMQAHMLQALAQCPVPFKALWLDREAEVESITSSTVKFDWVIHQSGPSHDDNGSPAQAEKVRAACLSAGLPLLELGAKPTLEMSALLPRSHPFPEDWGIDFTRPGVPIAISPVAATAAVEALVFETLDDDQQCNEVGQPSRFHDLDAQVRETIRAQINAAMALKEIRDEELWRDGGFASWNDYCDSLLEVSRSYVNKLICHAVITEELLGNNPPKDEEGAPVVPAGEAHSRPLKRLKTVKKRAKAWRLAVKNAGCAMPTAVIVEEAVAKYVEPGATRKPKESAEAKRRELLQQLRAAAEARSSWDEVLQLITEMENV